MNKYIKVEKGKSSAIVPAANKRAYTQQGFKITEPTHEEIITAFPEEKVRGASQRETSGGQGEQAQKVKELEKKLTAAEKAKDKLQEENKQLKAEIKKLEKQAKEPAKNEETEK